MSEERDIEAAKSIEVARKAIELGDFVKAKKFLLKSLNFRHSTKAEEMLKRVEAEMGKPEGERTSSRPAPQSPPPPSPSSSSTSTSSTTAEEPETPKYTKEQQDSARRVKKLTDYYSILSVEKTATETDIKAAYRKLALKFHPDKNQAPDAVDAFKKVSEAYSCLSDPKERAYYDQTGGDRRSAYSQAGPAEHYQQYAQPMTPEEIFNMFFEAHTGMRRQMHQRRGGFRTAQPRQHQQEERSGGLLQLVHMLPLLLLFLFSYLSAPGEETPFSLDKGNGFVYQRETPLGTPYFVNSNFGHRYGRDSRARAQVEALADQQFLKKLEDLCKKEVKEEKETLAKAKKKAKADPEELHRAHSFEKKSCERLQQMRSR